MVMVVAFDVWYSLVETEMHHFWSRDITCSYVMSLLDTYLSSVYVTSFLVS